MERAAYICRPTGRSRQTAPARANQISGMIGDWQASGKSDALASQQFCAIHGPDLAQQSGHQQRENGLQSACSAVVLALRAWRSSRARPGHRRSQAFEALPRTAPSRSRSPDEMARWHARSACFRPPCAAMRSSIAPSATTPICAHGASSRCRTKSRISLRQVEATFAELGRISDEMLAASTQLASGCRQCLSQDVTCRRGFLGSVRQRARHRFGCR